jgi:psiF repeat
MKKLISLMAVAFAFSMSLSPLANAADAPAKSAQQSKMGTCAADGKGKKGDEYKAFMKECLSAKKEAPAQQTKMKTCNADAKGKKGDERKVFMKECLRKG